MTSNQTLQFFKVLPKIISSYNNAYHRSIDMTPNQAELPQNEMKLRLRNEKIYAKLEHKKRPKPKISVNDHVRVSLNKGKFDRGYNQKFSNEVFKVTEILKHLPITLFKLADLTTNEHLDGLFYQSELTKLDPTGFNYTIKSIKRQTKTHVLASFNGYPSDYYEWIPKKNLRNI